MEMVTAAEARRVQKFLSGRTGIYAAQVGAYGPVKIGFARDIPMRVKRLRADYPSGPVQLVATARTRDETLIIRIREEFKAHACVYGIDWYEPTPAIMQFVSGLSKRG